MTMLCLQALHVFDAQNDVHVPVTSVKMPASSAGGK
jgi:hypothetical protein